MKTKQLFKITWDFDNAKYYMNVAGVREAKKEIKSMIFEGYKNIRLIDIKTMKLVDYENI